MDWLIRVVEQISLLFITFFELINTFLSNKASEVTAVRHDKGKCNQTTKQLNS